MKQKKIAVIGGGACGMVAAITAAREGACVTIYERNDRLGKKILATGNGKCNLGNLQLSIKDYHSSDMALTGRILSRFGTEQTIDFFESIGLMIKEKNGYLYPLSEQASSVLDVLRMAVERYGVEVRYHAKVCDVAKRKDGKLEISWMEEGEGSGSKAEASKAGGSKAASGNAASAKTASGKKGLKAVYDKVIIACGSKAAPKTGSDGSGYQLAKQLGITVTTVVPALVQLKCKEEYCKAIAGVRTDALIHIRQGRTEVATERGELQLTEYGISGIPVFQLSGQVNFLLKEKKDPVAVIDFLPDMGQKAWDEFAERRLQEAQKAPQLTVEAFFTGMLNKKLMTLFMKLAGLKSSGLVREISKADLLKVFALCKSFPLHIIGSNSYDNAQICAGGVSMKEVTQDLESKKVSGLYFAGEVLDVDGRCGGYNLQWAWSSGYVTGRAACETTSCSKAIVYEATACSKIAVCETKNSSKMTAGYKDNKDRKDPKSS